MVSRDIAGMKLAVPRIERTAIRQSFGEQAAARIQWSTRFAAKAFSVVMMGQSLIRITTS